jgi:hypothetical protein
VAIISVGVLAWGISAVDKRRARAEWARRCAMLERLRSDGILLELTGPGYRGTVRGRPIVWSVETTGSGDYGPTYLTSVTLEMAMGLFELDVRPPRALSALLGRGVPSLETGDARFDGNMVVEGAPAAVAKEVLDASTRGWLLDLRPASLRASEGRLVLEKNGQVADVQIKPLLLGLCHLADNVATATQHAMTTVEPPAAPPPARGYREPAAVTDLDSRLREQGREVAILRAGRAVRERRQRIVIPVLMALTIVGFLGAIAFLRYVTR